jgi:hypothetical protein
MNETPTATAAAFRELRDVAVSLNEEAWKTIELPDGAFETDMPDSVFVNALNDADDAIAGGNGDLARAVGIARADAIITPRADDFGGDPFRFLKEGASLVFEGRANYGASSVEVAPKKAVLRVVAPEDYARKNGDAPNRAPLLAAAFLERAIELIAGEGHAPRYIGHAPRIDSRFDRPMVNLMFEFDLDEG